MSSFASINNNRFNFSSNNNNNNNSSSSSSHTLQGGEGHRMCNSTRRLSALVEARSNETDDDCNSSFQGTTISNASSHGLLKQEEDPTTTSDQITTRGNNSNHDLNLDDGDIHFFDDNDGDDKSSKNNRNRHHHHHHHRSLSGLFSENASISEGGKMSYVPLPVYSTTHQKENKHVGTTDDSQYDGGDHSNATKDTYPSQQLRSSTSSSSVASSGKKHRRIYSGGVSNPPMAHRRINSRGNAAVINRNTAMNTINAASESMQNYHPYQQQQQHQDQLHQHASNRGRSSRSLSPAHSNYPTHEVEKNHHYRDDSDVQKYNSQHHGTSGYYKNYHSGSRSHPMHKSNKGVAGGSGSASEDQIAAAQWLQHFRRSPPLDISSAEYVEMPMPQAFPSDSPMNTSYRSAYHPSNKPFSKNLSRSESATGSTTGSPLQPYYDNYDSSEVDLTYSPFEGSLPSMSSAFRQSSTASSIASAPHPTHQHLHHQHTQYPTQQLQPNPGSGKGYDGGFMPQYHRGPNNYFAKPRGADSMISPSTSTYPVQQQNQRSYYNHQGPTHQQHPHPYFAAENAARKAVLRLPHHPLAAEGRPTQRRNQSTTSIESKIETDELLFQKDSGPTGYKSYPPKLPSSQQPHYRISPQLFQETLNELQSNEAVGSPTSLSLSNSYQESLLSSLVGKKLPSSSQQAIIQKPEEIGRSQHERNPSLAMFTALVDEMDDAQSKRRQKHRGLTSENDWTLSDKLIGEKFLDGKEIQIESDTTSKQSSIFQPELIKSKASKGSRSQASNSSSVQNSADVQPNVGRKITGSVSKRVRRKCSVEGCENRVVQGGLCISHGAKRKKCGYPGCTKNVKKAGMCSTHGPARKRCEVEGCEKVSVQGGKCIAHGAKKKLCKVNECKKQAILGGMCKKHHDMHKAGKFDFAPTAIDSTTCRPVSNQCSTFTKENEGNSPSTDVMNLSNSASSKPSLHRRGLSLFQEMSAVDTIIGSSSQSAAYSMNDSASRQNTCANESRGGNSAHNRGLSIFAEDEVVNKIVRNGI